MTTNAEARTSIVAAIDTLKAAKQDSDHKQLASAIETLTDHLRWLDHDIAINSGPVRVGDVVRTTKTLDGQFFVIESGSTGKVLGGLGNWNLEVIPVMFDHDTTLADLDSIEVVADADGNSPGERPDTWPQLAYTPN